MSDLKKFVKSSGIYLIGSVLNRLMLFFMLPLYTKFLTPADYGEFDISLTYMNFFVFVCFMDIHIGVMKFLLDDSNKTATNHKEKVLFSALCILFFSSIFYFLAFYIFLYTLDIKFIYLLIFAGLTSYLQIFYGYVCRAYGLNLTFVISGLVNTATNVATTLALLVFYKLNYEAMFFGIAVGNIINIFIVEKRVRLIQKLKVDFFDFIFLKRLFLYSLPLVFSAFSFYFIEFFSKTMIKDYVGLAENGYYAIALRFASIFSVILYCFKLAWQELSFAKNISDKESSSFYTNALNEYVKFLMLSAIVLLPVIKIIFVFFIDSAFLSAIKYTPWVILVAIAVGIYEFILNIINKIDFNRYIFIFGIVAVVLNVTFTYFFIDKMGVFAIIFAFIFAYIVICVIAISLINKKFKIKINFIKLLLFIFMFVSQSLIMINLDIFYNILSFVASSLIFFVFYFKNFKEIYFKFISKKG